MSIGAYRMLFYSAAIVIFGVMGQGVARGWLARELTGNNAGLGGVMLVFGVSMLFATPLGGVAADRYAKRTVLMWAVLALTVSSLLIGIAVVADVIEYWMLLIAGAIQAGAFAFYLPARIALISEVVPSALLQQAIVLSQMSQEAMRVVAPALAGVLVGVAWFGVGGVFLAAGLLGAISTLFIVALPRVPSRGAIGRSPFGEIVDAVSYVRATPGLAMVAMLMVGVVMIGFPYLTFLPTLADDRFGVGATGFGIMSGAAGLGAVIAGVADNSLNRGTRPWMTIAAAGAAFGAATIVLGLVNSYVTALVALVAVGGAGLLFQTSCQTLMLRISALEYHGRLQSMVILGFSGFGLAALPLGVLADTVSLQVTMVGMGVLVLAMTGAFTLARVRRRRRSVPPKDDLA